MDAIRVKVDGDAKGGWIVEIHDGERLRIYSPEEGKAERPEHAADHAEREYLKEFPKAAADRLFERSMPEVEGDDEPVKETAAKDAAKEKGRKRRVETKGAPEPTVETTGNA